MKNFLPNTHDMHVVKAKTKKPKEKICRKCLSFDTIKDKSSQPYKKIPWCQYYGKTVDPTNKGCKKFR